jgi:hypothetical protein
MGAVREGNWKLVINNHPPKLQYLDLAADIGEKQDLAATKPKVLDRLHLDWLEWGAAVPPRANPQLPGKKK